MEINEGTLFALDLNAQAALLIKSGNFAAAKEKLDSAMDEDPMVMETYKNYGDLYMAAEEYKEAKNSYKKALLIEKKGILYFHYGNACFMNDDIHEGLENYNLAITNGYDNDEMFFFMGMAYEHLNDDIMALRFYQKAHVKNPSRPDYLVKQINIEMKQGMMDSAEKDADILLSTAPELFDGYHMKSQLLLYEKRYDEAEFFAKAAADRFPEDIDLQMDYVRAVTMNQKLEQALSLIERASKMKYFEEARHEFLMLKAEILAEQNRFDEAMAVCDECISMETDEFFDGEARFLAMNLQLSKSSFDKALDHANRLVQQNLEDAYYFAALYYKGFCLKQMGQTEDAMDSLKEANSICRLYTLNNPNAVDVYLYRAMCLKDLEQYDRALELLDFILGLGEEFAEIYTVKAEIYDAMGMQAAASEQREKAYTLKPELKPIRE